MNSERLIGRILTREDVTARQREEMFALMDCYYAGMRREEFESDLDEKEWVIQIVDSQTHAIRGFSTQMMLQAKRRGRTVRALFSGDTIVDRQYWTGNPLAKLWGQFALVLIDACAGEELYWFLITKGFRTYRFLPVFFHEFYPREGTPTPPWAKETIDAFAAAKFPHAYDAAAGIVRSVRFACRLRPGVGAIDEARASDPHVRYFVARNPGHSRGDELCCLAPLTRENFTRAAYRTIGATTGTGILFGQTGNPGQGSLPQDSRPLPVVG
jgi:hypothetical protein